MLPFRPTTACAGIVVLIALLAACGQVPPSAVNPVPSPVPPAATVSARIPTVAATAATTQKSIDACALITPDETATALGTGSTPVQPHAVPGQVPSCNFQVAGKVPLKLFVHQYGSVKEALKAEKVSVDRVKDQPTFRKVAGIGDEAFAMGHSLAVRKQAIILTVSVTATQEVTSSITIAKGIAQTALGRLP